MANFPKPTKPRPKPPKSNHFVQFYCDWMSGTAGGAGIFVLPVIVLIVGLIVLQLAQIFAAR